MIDHNIDLTNISDLEHAFSKDFSSFVFPILANLYLQKKDFKRSRKVCEVGLEHSPNNTDGKFILAKVNLYENKLNAGEKLLKEVINENPIHLNALRIIIEVMRTLNRSPKSIILYIDKILQILPADKDSLALLESFPSTSILPKKTESHKRPKVKNKSTPKRKTTKAKNPIPKETPFDVSIGMASFTLVGVLRAQKHYKQALSVLSRLEEKGADKEKINSERQALEMLLRAE